MNWIKEKLKEKMKKLGRKKVLAVGAFSLAVFVILWAFISAVVITRNFNRDQLAGSENKQELDVSSVILIETKDDQKFWEIYAKNGSYGSDNKVAILENVTGNFYKDNEVAMSFVSSKGTYNEVKKQIILYEDTFIVIKDGTSLKCDTLIWSGSDKDILVNGNVKINKDGKLVSTAERAVISADYSDFKIIGNTVTKLYDEKENK